jgi:hypothetical protein
MTTSTTLELRVHGTRALLIDEALDLPGVITTTSS